MKKNILTTLVISAVAFFMTSCSDNATYVNETIVNRLEKSAELLNEVVEYAEVDDYATATAYLDSITNHISESTAVISKMKNKSAEQFIQTSLDYLNYFSTGVADYKKAIEIYQTAETNVQFEKANDIVNDFLEVADAKFEKVQEAQVEFAKANDITLH